jgi:hypothetical protein
VKKNLSERASYLDKVFNTSKDLKGVLGTSTQSKRAKEEIASCLTKDKKKIKGAVVEFVVENRLSFNIVENSSLGTLLTCFNPLAGEVLPTSHNTISNHMMREFENQKGLLQRLLKSS